MARENITPIASLLSGRENQTYKVPHLLSDLSGTLLPSCIVGHKVEKLFLKSQRHS